MSGEPGRSGGGGAGVGSFCPDPKPYLVTVSFRFIFLSLLSTILLAFTIGRAARIILIEGPRRALLFEDPADSSMYDRPDYHEGTSGPARDQMMGGAAAREGSGGGGGRARTLPEPVLLEGKEVPQTVYSSKTFGAPMTASSSSVHIVKDQQQQRQVESGEGWQHVCQEGDGASGDCAPVEGDNGNAKVGAETSEEEEEHLPAGQHLLVDIKNVDGTFLNSEERLARAMVDVVNDSKLTLLSYHCHSLIPMGVSCVGVLLESHISFHTWPDEGVITLDLFTCGSNPLVPVMPVIERLFAVPRKPTYEGEVVDPPGMIWSHKLRGFRGEDSHKDNPLAKDLGHFMLEIMDFDMKRVVASTESDFQRIDVYEVIRPRFRDLLSYQRSLSNDGSYESLHPELYLPDRVLFLDGVMQSTLYGDESYHEALVHPGMFAHPNPKRVAIIGGGEGATLREVLKHRTVEKVKMIEIDEVMVNIAREALPTWSDCSDLIGSADWCGDDGRAELHYEDALAWFIDRFSENGSKRDKGEQPFDVIIMDALDPQDHIPFAEVLYRNDVFLQALFNALTAEGVIIMQLGETPHRLDPAEELSRDKNRAILIGLLEKVGFESIHAYEESHSGFLVPWSHLVASKDYGNRARWYASPAEVELAIHKRIVRTKSGSPPLRYFDGATKREYQVPHKVYETVFCRKDPTPADCVANRGHNLSIPNVRVSSFEVKESSIGVGAGRGVFAKRAIVKGSMMAADESLKSVHFAPLSADLIKSYHEIPAGKKLRAVNEYMHGYGRQSRLMGMPEFHVDSGIMAFIKHGCDGTYNAGSERQGFETEVTVDLNVVPDNVDEAVPMKYRPARDRHTRNVLSRGEFALRDIEAGEEIFRNYLDIWGERREWGQFVENLRAGCKGEGESSQKDEDESKAES